jgi:hypothetical protein
VDSWVPNYFSPSPNEKKERAQANQARSCELGISLVRWGLLDVGVENGQPLSLLHFPDGAGIVGT